MDTQFKVIETTDKGEIWEANCPADPTIKPRRLKEKKKNETTDNSSDSKTINLNSSSASEEQGHELDRV